MTVSEFITDNIEEILAEWETTTRAAESDTSRPMTQERRDWARDVLSAAAVNLAATRTADRRQPETKVAQASRPQPLPLSARDVSPWTGSLTLDELVAEYRSLRAAVVRLWTASERLDDERFDEIVRFQDVINEFTTESIRHYSSRMEHAHNLFTAILGHDLRTPLATTLSAAEYLLTTAHTLDIEQTRALKRIRSSIERMGTLIDDLQDFTRVRLAGALPLSPETTNLARLGRELVEELRAYQPGRELRVDIEDDMAGTWDPTRIKELLSNLISNALEHGSRSSPVTTRIRAEEDGQVVISVHNYGNPIPPEKQHIIFDPLVRGERYNGTWHKGDGLGLGLHIAKLIVDAHGGHCGVTSSDEEGTTFTVRLPRHAPPSSASGADFR